MWYIYLIVLIVGIGVGYGFRGFINRNLRKTGNKVKDIV